MANRFNLCIPTTYTDRDGQDQTRFTRVGVMFRNENRDTGQETYNIKLDFPVGATELVAFEPKERDGET